jgi:hypothetical protein
MNPPSGYATPAAFRSALTERIKERERSSPWNVAQLQRQFAYDRLLARLYLVDDGWIVKGATALLARDLGVRGSLDIDLYREIAQEVAEFDFRRAAELEIDWMRFEIGPARPIGDGDHAVRLPVTSRIGTTIWVQFRVDLVGSDLRMTGQPEDVPPLARGVMPDVTQRGYSAYPIVDHVADKVAATFERHGVEQRSSTRYRDLVDLVAIVAGASVDAKLQQAALRSEFDRRRLTLPTHFEVPDRESWERGYAIEAGRSILSIAHSLGEALEVVVPFLNPLLDGRASGVWVPAAGAWALRVS